MAHARRSSFAPIATINITPLIDVMLVLLIMLIILIPLAEHSLDVDLPGGEKPPLNAELLKTNKIVVTEGGAILWNGEAISEGQLVTLLQSSVQLRDPPHLLLEPEAKASYAQSAEVIRLIKLTGVEKFTFVGNERYRVFARTN